METVKCVVVGDGAVGKTCLLMSYTAKMFPREYIPTIFDNYSSNIDYNGQHVRLDLYDTAGQEDYDRLRVICYANTNVFIVCYSIASKISLSNVEKKWVPELKVHAPDTPIILLGLKSDLRLDSKKAQELESEGKSFVTKDEAEEMRKTIGAKLTMECSALKMEGINEAFEAGITVALEEDRAPGDCPCTIL